MKKLLLLFASCLLLSSCIISYLDDSMNMNTTEDYITVWLNRLCSKELLGRKTGSIGDSLAFSYIMNEIEAMGYQAEVQRFKTESGTTLRNIVVNVAGEKLDSVIVIGAHYDGAKSGSDYAAANDNASGCVSNLIILKTLKERTLSSDYGVTCCFWDSEEVFEGRAFRGSTFFVQNYENKAAIHLYLNLDTIGHSHETMGVVRSDEMKVNHLIDILPDETSFEWVIRDPFDGSFSDFVSFRSLHIPYIGFHDHCGIDCKNSNHSSADVPSEISISKLITVSNICLMFVENY